VSFIFIEARQKLCSKGEKRCSVQESEFRKIYQGYSRKLYNFILWMSRNRAAADDILQNVFASVWKCKSAPAGEVELQRWLFTIARNASMDFFRKASRFSRFRAQYDLECDDHYIEPDTKHIWRELSVLPDTDRGIIYLHIKCGYSYREIGEMLNITENSVRVKAFRALKKLKESLTRKEL